MKKVEIKDATVYEAAGHFGVTTMRLNGKDETGAQKFWVGLSHFLPGGGADMAGSGTEKYYFVLDGEITVSTPEGTEYVLRKNDSIFIGPNEQRALLNKTKMTVSMLVTINYP
jgi:glyoxylate utilization-related uncharacterized protein